MRPLLVSVPPVRDTPAPPFAWEPRAAGDRAVGLVHQRAGRKIDARAAGTSTTATGDAAVVGQGSGRREANPHATIAAGARTAMDGAEVRQAVTHHMPITPVAPEAVGATAPVAVTMSELG